MQLALTKGKEIHWTEYGVGGGTCQSGNCVAEVRCNLAAAPSRLLLGMAGLPERHCLDDIRGLKVLKHPAQLLHAGGICLTLASAAAQTAAQAAHYPFFGIWGPYRAEMDPWQLAAKQPPPPRQYLWYFYNQTAQYLTDQVGPDAS